MNRGELERNWDLSAYQEGTEDEVNYYFKERKCNIGDKGYLYSFANNELLEMEIIHIIRRSDNPDYYDKLIENEDVLLEGEDKYEADTSAEFITDNDCYLVWFNYIEGENNLINTIKEDCKYWESLEENQFYNYMYLNECRNSKESGLYQLILNGQVLWCGTLAEINAVVKTMIMRIERDFTL